MGLSPSELEQISPYEFELLLQGYRNRQVADWERARYAAWINVSIHSKNPPAIEDMLPLPIDEQRKELKKSIEKNAAHAKKISSKMADKINDLFK